MVVKILARCCCLGLPCGEGFKRESKSIKNVHDLEKVENGELKSENHNTYLLATCQNHQLNRQTQF